MAVPNERSLNDRLVNLVFGLVMAAVIGIVGWAFSIQSRVAAMEMQQISIQRSLTEMATDIRDIRTMMEADRRERVDKAGR
jgi:hypothetical protein